MMDISVAHDRDACSSKQRKEQQKTNSGRRGSIPPNIQQAQSIDTMDGAFDELREIDSFLHAYRQPALRANLSTRPEQPFPPGQLGREDVIMNMNRVDSAVEA